MKKKALITGITGQDGSYLAELLLSEGYEVHGIVRKTAVEYPITRIWRIKHIQDRLILHEAALDNYGSVYSVVQKVMPDECYHLGAQSFVKYSFEDPFTVMDVNVNGTLSLLESIRRLVPGCKLYFAGTSEMFGNAIDSPQTENTPFSPCSPYAVSKVAGFNLCRTYRDAYNMFISNGILFNHESPRRGMEFVTRKITHFVARLVVGQSKFVEGFSEKLPLGNLDAKRDWGYAKDYVQAMYRMLQQEVPDDFVIATNETHSIKELCTIAFEYCGFDWEDHVVVDKAFCRPKDINVLRGDFSKAATTFGWNPTISFTDLIELMVDEDILLIGGKEIWKNQVTKQQSSGSRYVH